ncbi:unnamed protein product [Protopolystoma xenopodis]|uniref:Uncharacterized protein n=1 Tax=Protopolystoma xenopodis TaxID=117903 RepID=A0A3S5CCP6_9PLAT|nr:unnamed protein product [Protopolystoma xenopodis]
MTDSQARIDLNHDDKFKRIAYSSHEDFKQVQFDRTKVTRVVLSRLICFFHINHNAFSFPTLDWNLSTAKSFPACFFNNLLTSHSCLPTNIKLFIYPYTLLQIFAHLKPKEGRILVGPNSRQQKLAKLQPKLGELVAKQSTKRTADASTTIEGAITQAILGLVKHCSELEEKIEYK